MKTAGRRIVLVTLIFVVLVGSGKTCGPSFDGLVFTREHGPDGPINAFATGKVGIPLPGWWRAYLVVAYRYLEDKPLSQAEARSFAEFWGAERDYGFPSDPAKEALKKWLKVRQHYSPKLPRENLEPYKNNPWYNSSLNCTFSAFATAIDTLHSRAKRFGDKSPELQQWIESQDAVFENCDGEHAHPVFPPQLPAQADPLLRADRAYQTAAVYFYTGDYQKAVADFDAIGEDATSPWQPIAPYLAARSILRQVAAGSDPYHPEQSGAVDISRMKEAQQRLQAIIKDPSRKEWHHDARKLLNYIAFRTEPLQYQHRLAAGITRGSEGEDFGQNVKDYTLLLDGFLEHEPDFPGIDRDSEKYDQKLEQWRKEQYNTLAGERADDLTDWIITFQSDSKAGRVHAVRTWRASRTLPWLYLALSKLSGTDPASPEAIEAAGKIAPESPLYAAFHYHRARLLMEKGNLAGAREALEKILATKKDLSLSTINLIKVGQTRLSPNRNAFVALLPRQPVMLATDWYDDEDSGCYNQDCKLTFYGTAKPAPNSHLLSQFDPATARWLNGGIPTDELIQIANEKALPGPLQRRLATAVWARAALLDQPDQAARVADTAVAAAPELERFVLELAKAENPEERRFVAAFAIAHFPGLRPFVDSTYPRETAFAKIDNYRDNWWCPDVGGNQEKSDYEKQWQSGGEPSSAAAAPAFLTPDQARSAGLERSSLRHLGGAQDYLPQILISWAKTHPDDPRAPEALHFSWRASRYGCGEGDKKQYNRQAFKLLHKNYPKSEWTKKTKIWFSD